ncbi:MAG: hypothetical protein IJY66_07035 [Clostridia bacterium]|nr:hypothetical protein [Clostridia bacterium]
MSIPKQQRMMMVLSVILRGTGKQYREMLESRGIRFHLQTVGFGTAPSEMMDIFGLGSNDKDIVVSIAPRAQVSALASDLAKNLDTAPRYGGLMTIFSLDAINRLSAEILSRSAAENTDKGADTEMKSEFEHKMIMVTVNQGYTDQVMQTAKRAGATGGTILRARLAGSERLQQFDEPGMEQGEEKEIILILAPASNAGEIMNEVNRAHGLKTEAKGVVCAVPVEHALKI